jgi:hypothetical protein
LRSLRERNTADTAHSLLSLNDPAHFVLRTINSQLKTDEEAELGSVGTDND